MTELKLDGAGPFSLPCAQTTYVAGSEDALQITFRVLADGQATKPVTVPITAEGAKALIEQLLDALKL